MTSILLASPFSRPLHVTTWKRPAGNLDYRVTNQFNGPDFLNGGKHEATDCGNTSMNEPLKAMVAGLVLPLKHFDGALGVRHVLPDGVTLDCWHLNRVDVPVGGATVTKGTRIGLTGNSGAKLPDGSPMPAHTHIRAERNGVPFDVEFYIPMVERAAKPLVTEEDDMQLPAGLSALTYATLAAGNRIRVHPSTIEGAVVLEQPEFVQVFGQVTDASYTLGGKTGNTWYFVGRGLFAGYVATPLLPDVDLTKLGREVVDVPTADCSAQEAVITQLRGKIARAQTANDGAQQAQNAVEAALA